MEDIVGVGKTTRNDDCLSVIWPFRICQNGYSHCSYLRLVSSWIPQLYSSTWTYFTMRKVVVVLRQRQEERDEIYSTIDCLGSSAQTPMYQRTGGGQQLAAMVYIDESDRPTSIVVKHLK